MDNFIVNAIFKAIECIGKLYIDYHFRRKALSKPQKKTVFIAPTIKTADKR